ncbi:hypothetical protein HDR58_04925 [bacterium]|nr:hypothetical protein [bacterium]
MSCKMLFFDYRESEKAFFEKNHYDNFEIKFFNENLNEETVNNISEEDLESAMIISVFITSNITEKVVEKFKNLRIISTRSTGVDHIDLEPCVNKNIAVINVESYGVTSVAQFTFALLLTLQRQIFPAVLSIKTGECVQHNYTGNNLASLTLGIIGTGAIGASVCAIASSFGMHVIGYDLLPKKELEQKYNIEYTNLENLLERSDIVSLHLPYTKDNYHLISDRELKKMKDNSYLINVSRGELINLEALLKYVKNGKLKGVGLDVVACVDSTCIEEVVRTERSSLLCLEESKVVKELNNYPNVIITPHIAYDTQESVDYILQKTFDGLKDFLYGGKKYRLL